MLVPATQGVMQIAAERLRQRNEEGYDSEHDKGHAEELLRAADAYTQYVVMRLAEPYTAPELFSHPADFDAWPWSREAWKPDLENMTRNLEKAGALIAAAIDSLNDRKE